MSWKSNTLPELSQAFELLGVDPYYQIAFTSEQDMQGLYAAAAKLPPESTRIVMGGLLAGLREAMHDSMTDSLTQLPNRAGFIDALGEKIKKMRQNDEGQAAILFLDLDGFKKLNDRLGHHVGDRALKDVAQLLDGTFSRKTDLVGRLGGDEMVVFLPYKNREFDERVVKEKIREALGGIVYGDLYDEPYPIGVSIGVAEFKAADLNGASLTEQISKLLRCADTNMYKDKWGPTGEKPKSYQEGEIGLSVEMPPKDLRLWGIIEDARAKAPRGRAPVLDV